MTDHTIDILILTPVDANELTGLIHQPGLLGTWSENQTIHVYWKPSYWTPQVHKSIINALRILGIPNPDDLVGTSSLPSQDWNTEWASQVKPIRIGQHIRIRPSWEPASFHSKSIELIIDPKQAFGTGHHTSTQLLVEWLEEVITGGETLLDIGTGTGILAMVAVRLGAKQALGFDFDPQAINCALDYARTNRFGKELVFLVATLEECPTSRWDLIVANVDRQTILSFAEKLNLFLSPKGQLFLSGLLIEDYEEIIAKFKEQSWIILESRHREEWLGLRLTHLDKQQKVLPANAQDSQSVLDT